MANWVAGTGPRRASSSPKNDCSCSLSSSCTMARATNPDRPREPTRLRTAVARSIGILTESLAAVWGMSIPTTVGIQVQTPASSSPRLLVSCSAFGPGRGSFRKPEGEPHRARPYQNRWLRCQCRGGINMARCSWALERFVKQPATSNQQITPRLPAPSRPQNSRKAPPHHGASAFHFKLSRLRLTSRYPASPWRPRRARLARGTVSMTRT